MAQIRDDHYEAAVQHIDNAIGRISSGAEIQPEQVMLAHAEALLEIASQLKTANLINAYDRDALIHPGINSATPGTDEWHVQRLSRQRFEQQLAQQITDVLGMGA